jgi:hypothetical protein
VTLYAPLLFAFYAAYTFTTFPRTDIFIMPDGDISLIDCGQVKQITETFRLKLAKVVLLVSKYLAAAGTASSDDLVCDEVKCRSIVPELADDVVDGDECAAAVALLLFGTPDVELPGGYSHMELSNLSPIKKVQQFPQELVMLGRGRNFSLTY